MHPILNTDVSQLLGGLLCLMGVVYLYSTTHKLRHIPSVGSSLPILSHFSAFRFLFRSQEMLAEGVRKYPNGIFKIPEFWDWHVVIHGPKLIAEYRKIPEHVLSARVAFEAIFLTDYTVHSSLSTTPDYHVSVVRSQLTRSIAKITSQIHDEVVAAFDEYLPMNVDGEWEKFPVLENMSKIVSRASNRVFVGLPLCRDPSYLALSIEHTMDVAKIAMFLNVFPKFLRRFIVPLISQNHKQLGTFQRLLMPLIEARRQEVVEKGEYTADQDFDAFTWLLKDPFGRNSSDVDLTCRLFLLNFGSIHTTSITFTHVLYDLAAHPEYAEPLREEAARLVEPDGWTKAVIDKMDKIDSFIKESMRFNALAEMLMPRFALQDYTFAGTFIPRGTFIHVAIHDAHFDGDNYQDPTRFDGFRFVKLKGQPNVNERLFDMTATSPEFLSFGTGVHACPGRFFVANEMKLILAHVVLNYDVKLENDGGRPPNTYFKAACMPDPTTKLLFRRRKY